ncbi:winged helix-turn-helix transcriptional regulator [Nocardia speluncae]|uniref:Winged helix-turn-helix transcriptional regulator n=1 Tax=Nocardia speluncae TaxID=419477 RepID=A0A846XAL0_9NOCA|nr:MarR family winged helix-turn-helix transcriptional regulator [Nocardia speluncae]NKY33321.1 winged helix-turn-helix transcriptional regulator [Nocardia speluncae]
MTPAGETADTAARISAETDIATDIRALTAISEQIAHLFARSHALRSTDFRALMHIATADAEGHPLTAGQLRELMGLSPAAITYLVERMIASGHIERETDPRDRRRVLLHYADHGMAVAGEFFGPLGGRTRAAMTALPTDDLRAAHRVLQEVVAAMRDHHTALNDQRPAGG